MQVSGGRWRKPHPHIGAFKLPGAIALHIPFDGHSSGGDNFAGHSPPHPYIAHSQPLQ